VHCPYTQLAPEEPGSVEGQSWPPRRLATMLISTRSTLDCHTAGSVSCAACRYALELPLALARAADDAAADHMNAGADELIAKALYVAELLSRSAPVEIGLMPAPPGDQPADRTAIDARASMTSTACGQVIAERK